MIFPKTKNARASVFCLPFRGGGKNRQLKLSIFAGGVSTAQVENFLSGIHQVRPLCLKYIYNWHLIMPL